MAKILIVDDEPDLRFLLRVILERGSHEVVEATDGLHALELVAESTPELVMTDLMMPNMDGRSLLGALRANPKTSALPVVVITAISEPIDGADAVVRKPFGPIEILQTVDALIRAT